MTFHMYPKNNVEGFTADEVRRGIPWIYTDVECPRCGKLQPVAMTHYVGGPCVRCGGLTSGETREG